MPAPTSRGEIFVEFIVRGAVVKATAIDSKSGTEASIVGPAAAPRAALEAAAVQKLNYVLKKRNA
jgi:hypothetical protein